MAMMNRLRDENTQLTQQNLLLTQEVQKLRGVISQLLSGSYAAPHSIVGGGLLNQNPSRQASLMLGASQQFSKQQQQILQQQQQHQPNHVLQMLSQQQVQQLGQQGKTELQPSTSGRSGKHVAT
jgi:hypothetical protein